MFVADSNVWFAQSGCAGCVWKLQVGSNGARVLLEGVGATLVVVGLWCLADSYQLGTNLGLGSSIRPSS